MTCKHANLMLLNDNKPKLRCKHCHLTIKIEDLAEDFCPECFEVSGKKLYDFEKIENTSSDPKYRCEDCGASID